MSWFTEMFKTTVIDTIRGFDIVKRPDRNDKNGDYIIMMYTNTYVFSIGDPHQLPNVYNIKRVKTRKKGEKIIEILNDYNYIDLKDAFDLVQTL